MRFAFSFAEQAMGSLITFGINLWLIRNGAAASYGTYVFWFSVAWVLGTCQGTLTITHLFNLPSGPDRAAERRDPERILLSVSLLLMVVACLGVLGANALLRHQGSELSQAAAAGFIPAFLLYQYVRAFAFSRGRPALAAALTAAVLCACVLGLGLDRLAGTPPNAARVLGIVGAAYGGCAAVILHRLLQGARPMLRPSELRRYAHYLRGSVWMVLGAGSAEVTSRLYSFVVVDWFGVEALARLAGVQVVIRPAWMLSAAWSSVGFPAIATRRAAGDRRGVARAILQGAAATSFGSLIWSGAVIAAWPLISGTLYRGRYEDAAAIAYLWAGNVILGSIAVAFNIGLLAIGEFRRLALVDVFGALVCAACLPLLVRAGYPLAIVATMAGQFTQILLMAVVLTLRLRSSRTLAA